MPTSSRSAPGGALEVGLFEQAGADAAAAGAPLAARLRPATLDEVVGQSHLTATGTPLRRLVDGDGTTSILLWGPPGTGKTTLAYVVANQTDRTFRELSAVTAGVKDVRAAIDEAAQSLAFTGRRTVLFVDEVHRFSKTQQDALLPAVERGTVTLVAATTENPFFSVIGPLLSRSLLLTLEPLGEDDIETVIRRALRDPRGYGGTLAISDEALGHLIRLAAGDARKALTMLESAAGAALDAGAAELDLQTLERAVDRAALRYDRDGDQHYDVISAFIKSVRGSDVDAALHYLARMIASGEDPRFVARRLMILASEDIGLADPTSLQTAVAAATTLEMVGLPEARLALAQATIHLSLAPKSNAVIAAMDTASADVAAGRFSPVPNHLRDKHYPGARKLGHGDGYLYPHDFPETLIRQQYPPDALVGADYYVPTDHGFEARTSARVATTRAALRGGTEGTDAGSSYRPPCTPVRGTPQPETAEETEQ